MNLAITGFPGWLTRALLDDLLLSSPPNLHVTALVHPGQISAAQALRSNYPFIEKIVAFDLGDGSFDAGLLAGVDTLLHTAAVIHVKTPREWYDVNHVGTATLGAAAKSAGVRRFVFMSSNAAGGKSDGRRLMTEADEPKPLSHYGRSKLLAESALRNIEVAGAFDVVILRPSMFYGPPVPLRHVDVYKRIMRGTMPLVGNGEYRRSITYIDNLVQATRLALTHPAAAGETYYIVDEPVYTTRSIVEAMAEALGVRPRFIHLPAAASQAAYALDELLAKLNLYVAPLHLLGEADWHTAISCDKAKRQLGYSPKFVLRDGMAQAIEWCRQSGALTASN